MSIATTLAQSDNLQLTTQEKQWLKENKGKEFTLGLDPLSGIEHFEYKGQKSGYIYDLVKAINKDLDILIRVEATKSWGEVFDQFNNGQIDILIGANENDERKRTMAFTRAIYKYPYALFSYQGSNIENIGDIDGKQVAFIRGDIVSEIMPTVYKNIKYKAVYYPSQNDAVRDLANRKIQAFITSGGDVGYAYMQRFPNVSYISNIHTITSDMSLATSKQNEVFAGILDKELAKLENEEIPQMLANAEVMYIRKLLNLTPAESNWLENDGTAVVGITKDYLPIDYYENGKYLGISGAILNEISRKTGIRFSYLYSDFDVLYPQLEKGDINVLNIAKTEEKLKTFIYPRPYLMEREQIYGRKNSPDVLDIYGLEGKSVAVVEGFWHNEVLKKSLSSVKIISTPTLQESMQLVNSGKADYFIENPSVVKFYMEELDMFNIMQKGTTSNDSYLYFGISKNKPELASIIDKVLPMLNIQELARKGFNQIPRKTEFERNYKWFSIIFILVIALTAVIYILISVFRNLVQERTTVILMKAREEYFYTDSLTGVFNRNYLNEKIIPELKKTYPNALIICDMNNLKFSNDNYGHCFGDKLIKKYVDFLKKNTCGNTLVRMGGDEFLIIMPGNGEEQASELSNRLLGLPKEYVQASDGEIIEVCAAYGYSVQSGKDINIDEMIKEADQQMYKVKRCQKGS
jgi:diguanylate cyclase (GGDEF)-like protein